MSVSSHRIIAFSHIPKTGGQTLVYLFRKNFGAGHIIVRKRTRPTLYRLRDLQLDLRLNPWVRSMSGHPLKPFEDFRDLEDRLAWITMLRDPIKRYISHYQHQFDRGREEHKVDFRSWMNSFHRRNWMVRMMAQEDDLEAAKQIIQEKVLCVGFTEKYNESLLLFRHLLGLPKFDVTYGRPKNVASRKQIARSVADRFDEFSAAVREENELDLELYNWAMETLWPAQIARYGGREQLDQALEAEFGNESPDLADRLSLASNYLHRNLYYKPIVRVDRYLHRSRGQ